MTEETTFQSDCLLIVAGVVFLFFNIFVRLPATVATCNTHPLNGIAGTTKEPERRPLVNLFHAIPFLSGLCEGSGDQSIGFAQSFPGHLAGGCQEFLLSAVILCCQLI